MKAFVKKLYHKFANFLYNFWLKIKAGIAAGAITAIYIYTIIIALNFTIGFGKVVDVIFFLLFITLVLFLTYGFTKFLFQTIKRFDLKITAILITVIIMAFSFPMNAFLKLILGLEIISFAFVAFAYNHGFRKISSIILVLIAFAANIYIVYFLVFYGTPALKSISDSEWKSFTKSIEIENPLNSGEYKVASLYYGSGEDSRRAEFRDSISLKTNSVDVNKFFNQSSGFTNWMRENYWGFNSKNYPINGRVWYPKAQGQFPLVIIVHGNHNMEDYSDPGYEYLGRHLASKGFITVSVDENFLNGTWYGDYQQKENFTRGYLLLEHIKNWTMWNNDSTNLFYKKIDLNNIALIGHSRGGQAVAIAAAINKLPYHYTDGKIKFDFNYSIKSIIQIAPNDPYQPKNGESIKLKNINYLLLQGGYDYDVSAMYGIRQYNRITFDKGTNFFKSLIYIHKANHGNFNTVWGNNDFNYPSAFFMNTKPLLKSEEQQNIAKFYITSFLNSTLLSEKEYLPIFRNFNYGKSYLPQDYYISQYEDSKFVYLNEFDDDLNLSTSNTPGIKIEGNNLSVWSENSLTLRDFGNSLQNNYGIYLGWNKNDSLYKDKVSSYDFIFSDSVKLPESLDVNSKLFFFAANNRTDKDTADFSIVLTDAFNNSSYITLSDYYNLAPVLQSNLTKDNFFVSFIPGDNGEKVLQLCEIPIADFQKLNPSFQINKLAKISFVFDKNSEGEIILDKIGYYN